MSRFYSAAQYEQDYLPKRLNNWQVNPTIDTKYGTAETRYSTLQAPAKQKITFLVDDRGHLKPGVQKISNSFRTKLGTADSAPTRWPKPSPVIKAAPAATMGSKGRVPCCETGKPVYDGVVATRLTRRYGNASAVAAN